MVKAGYLLEHIDTSKALLCALDLLLELAAMQKEIQELEEQEKKGIADYEQRKQDHIDHVVPSIPDLYTRCKTILQKAHHVVQYLVEYFKLFYPDYNYGLFKNMPEFIEQKYPQDEQFKKFVNEVAPFMEIVRLLRNCIDHRKAELTITDFELQLSSDILTPTIEMKENQGMQFEKISLTALLAQFTEHFLYVFETLQAFVCNKNLKPNGVFASHVAFVPEDKRLNKFIKYAYKFPIMGLVSS